MDTFMLLFPVLVPLGGFLVARIARRRAQRPVYLALLLAPPATLSLITLALPSEYTVPIGGLEWIGIVLLVVTPAFMIWAVLVSIGYAAGRMSID